jgi:hypothetical protein
VSASGRQFFPVPSLNMASKTIILTGAGENEIVAGDALYAVTQNGLSDVRCGLSDNVMSPYLLIRLASSRWILTVTFTNQNVFFVPTYMSCASSFCLIRPDTFSRKDVAHEVTCLMDCSERGFFFLFFFIFPFCLSASGPRSIL